MIDFFRIQKNHANLWLFLIHLVIQLNSASFLFHELTLDGVLLFGFSILVQFSCGWATNKICNKYQLFSVPSNLPFLVFLLLCGLLSFTHHTTYDSIDLINSSLFLSSIFSVYFLFKAYKSHHPEREVFHIGLLLGLQSVLFIQSFTLVVAYLFIIPFLMIMKGRGYLLLFIGLFISLFLFYCLQINFNVELTNPVFIFLDKWEIPKNAPILSSYLGLLFFISLITWAKNSYRLERCQQPYLSAMSAIGFCTLAIIVFSSSKAILLFISPFSILISFAFYLVSKKLANLLLLLLLGGVLILPWIL